MRLRYVHHGMSAADRAVREAESLKDLIEALGYDRLAGVTMTVADIVRLGGISERTVRRYVSAGRLIPSTTSAGMTHRFDVTHVLDALGYQQGAPALKAPTSPLVELRGALDALTEALSAERARHEQERRELIERLDAQARLIDELRAEQRDARAQLHQFQEQVIKALPEPKRPWWRLRK